MENIKVSLCIPTIDRFDTFLESYIDKYLDYLRNGLIDEIIINDENGNDYEKIKNKYNVLLNENIKVYKNETILGPFMNKIKVCKYAQYEYIVLMDSDNFAEDTYFLLLKKYILENISKLPNYFVLSPSFAKPNFNYKHFENQIITKQNVNEYKHLHNFACMMNTGNYLITKSMITDLNPDFNIVQNSHSADVIYFNTLCFQQFNDFQFHVIDNLEYNHVVHEGSCYTNSSRHEIIRRNAELIHSIFYSL